MTFDPGAAPIRFRRVRPGEYVSTCEGQHRPIRELAVEAVDRRRGYTMEFASDPEQHRTEYDLEEQRLAEATWDACPRGTCGRFRIHRTMHSGRHVTMEGRSRWWLHDVSHGRPVHRWSLHHGHHLTMEAAIQMLCIWIGDGIRDAFKVLHEIRAEHAERERIVQLRVDREARVAVLLVDDHGEQPSVELTAARVIDALFDAQGRPRNLSEQG